MGSNIALPSSIIIIIISFLFIKKKKGCPEEEGRTRPIPFKVNLQYYNNSIKRPHPSLHYFNKGLDSKYI